jgi:hypothetical protein
MTSAIAQSEQSATDKGSPTLRDFENRQYDEDPISQSHCSFDKKVRTEAGIGSAREASNCRGGVIDSKVTIWKLSLQNHLGVNENHPFIHGDGWRVKSRPNAQSKYSAQRDGDC